jgi:hypothetical protein
MNRGDNSPEQSFVSSVADKLRKPIGVLAITAAFAAGSAAVDKEGIAYANTATTAQTANSHTAGPNNVDYGNPPPLQDIRNILIGVGGLGLGAMVVGLFRFKRRDRDS